MADFASPNDLEASGKCEPLLIVMSLMIMLIMLIFLVYIFSTFAHPLLPSKSHITIYPSSCDFTIPIYYVPTIFKPAR